MDVMEQLYRSLDSRMTPEAVCKLIAQAPGTPYLPAQRRVLERAASARAATYSSMSEDFERPEPLEHKVRMLVTLLRKDISDEAIAQMAGDPWVLLGQLRMVAPFVGWHPGSDFRSRLRRDQMAESAPGLSRRRYNRLVRHMLRTQAKAKDLQRQILLRQLVTVGRSGLAYTITPAEMRDDPTAACFVAYWCARRNQRRRFTLANRDNPFDTIAEMLLNACIQRGDRTNWWMIARAYPQPVIVARLTAQQQGELMGQWSGFMRLGAEMLRDLYEAWPTREIEPVVADEMWKDRPGLMPSAASRGARTVKVVNLSRMTVKKGVDSSTWNTVAQAYNAARTGWINCLGAAGALDLLDVACPGKAMRLMAGDLVAMHGGQIDPETQVWANLPLPWQVILEERTPSTAAEIEYECAKAGVDPHARGWTAPRQVGHAVAEWKPTPELVHGIEVADPLWAGLLRRAGVFSGKGLKADAVPLVGAYAAEQAGAQS